MAEPVTSSLLTLAERRRAAFPPEFSLTLRRTAPFVRIPLISPVCAFAFPFAIPSSLRSSLRVQLFPPKKPRIHPRLFAVRNSPQCGVAARLTAEPVTITADAHGKAPGGIPVRLFRWLSAVRLRRCDCLTSRLCNRLPFRSLFRPRSVRPYKSGCFHQSKPKTNHYQVEVVLVFSFLISSFFFKR